MANSTSQLDLLSSSQAYKEVSANNLFDACSTAITLGRRASTTSGLVWGYFGGTVRFNSVLSQIANGTVNLTASQTNYIEFNLTSGAIEVNTSAWTGSAKARMYKVVTGASGITSYEDWRDFSYIAGGGGASLKNYVEGSQGTVNVANNYGNVAIGYGNTITNDGYTNGWVLGCNNNISSNGGTARRSYVFGYGNDTSCSEENFVIGSFNNSTGESGKYNLTYGFDNKNKGYSGYIFGHSGVSRRMSSFVWSAGKLANNGDAQSIKNIRLVMTTDATPTPLAAQYATGVPSSFSLATYPYTLESTQNATILLTGKVVARSTSGALNSCWEIKALIKNVGGVDTIIGTPTITMLFQDAGASAWSVGIALYSGNINVNVTGANGQNIKWLGDLQTEEVIFA